MQNFVKMNNDSVEKNKTRTMIACREKQMKQKSFKTMFQSKVRCHIYQHGLELILKM